MEAVREIDAAGAVTIIAEEPIPAYSRPLISKYLAGVCTVDEMRFRPTDFYDKNRVDLITAKKAVAVDAAAKTVKLDDGSVIEFEKLLIAAGGKRIVPK